MSKIVPRTTYDIRTINPETRNKEPERKSIRNEGEHINDEKV